MRHSHRPGTVIDYEHWQMPLGRRFRALKLWFVLRRFGASGIRNHLRRGIAHRRLDRPSSAGPLRRGTFFILPPVLLVYTEDHYTKTIVVTNNSAPSSLQAPCS